MSEIRKAATILLGRDGKDSFEILLLKRNKALAFAGGLWVFPGGKVEKEEMEQSTDELSAARLAAIRETKEEASLDIDPERLVFYRHWTTPVIEPRRYATYFFYAEVPDANAKVQIDDSEIKEHQWIHPMQALERFKAGQLAMLPPTLMSLQLISNCKSAKEANQLLEKESPIYILPVLEPRGTKMICMYEGDAGFETTKADTPGPRHRLTIDMTNGDFAFEYQDC
ncbi:MAG: NUDIX hydrolase, partial [Bacteroidota bacterium]